MLVEQDGGFWMAAPENRAKTKKTQYTLQTYDLVLLGINVI